MKAPWDAKRKRDERAADKAELERIRAGHDQCTCGHPRSEHAPARPGEISCRRPLCGHLLFEPDPKHARWQR